MCDVISDVMCDVMCDVTAHHIVVQNDLNITSTMCDVNNLMRDCGEWAHYFA